MPNINLPPRKGPTPLEQLSSHYDKLTDAKKKLDIAREGMDGLVKMGDTVDIPAVVKVAGRLVAEGLDPAAMAALLAEMPEKPELLVEWIQQHDQQLVQREEDLGKMQMVVRHQLGVEGLRALMSPGVEPPPEAPVPSGPSMMLPSTAGSEAPNA